MSPLLLGLAVGLWFLGGAEVRSMERAAAADIAAKLEGPEKQVSVQASLGPEALFGDVHGVTLRATRFHADRLPLFTEPERSRAGVLRNLWLDLSEFSLKDLHVKSLRATLRDSRFDLGLALRKRQIRLSRSGEGPVEVVLTEQALERFIVRRFREIKQVEVRLARDKIQLHGMGEFVLFDARFFVVARLEPQAGDKLALADARVFIDDRPASESARDVLLSVLNPVVDLGRDLELQGAVTLQKVVLRDGEARVFGSLRIPEHPRE